MKHAYASILVAVCSFVTVAGAEPKVEEQVVGPAWEQGVVYTLSPRGMHVATASMKGSRWVVTVDGVEGPKFDQVFNAAAGVEVQKFDTGAVMSQQVKWQGPVAFSPDGSRYAYAARDSKDVVVICDGKEIFRAPFSQVTAPVSFMNFTPDGKHLFFYSQTADTMQSFVLMMDGKPATPPFDMTPYPFFSADGSRWGVLGTKATQQHEPFLVIDGSDAGYVGGRAQFTPDGKHVVCVQVAPGGMQQNLLVDGKPILSNAAIERYIISPSGDIGAIATVNNKKGLYINGQPAPGGDDAWGVTFSPDGKHWAALCQAAPRAWVVTDGKKGQEYVGVSDVAFTPDSSRCIYIAEVPPKKFVVVNGEEEQGNSIINLKPLFADSGGHYAYTAGGGAGTIKAYFDGKELPQSYLVFGMTLSPDGSRMAYYAAHDALSSGLVVDGKVYGGAGGQGGQPLFSPDSKHVVAFAQSPTDRNATLFIDGDYMPPPQGAGYPRLLGFTPDSQHLLVEGTDSVEGRPAKAYYIDGNRVAVFSAMGVNWINPQLNKFWEVQDDGSVVFVGAAPSATGYGQMKRVRVTPDSSTGVATMVSAYQADAKAKADAAKAAADKAAADKKAAQDKAAADAKAAHDKAIADRKAAQEKAAAQKAAKKAGTPPPPQQPPGN